MTKTLRVRMTRTSTASLVTETIQRAQGVKLGNAADADAVMTSAMTDAQCETYLRLSAVVFAVNLGCAA